MNLINIWIRMEAEWIKWVKEEKWDLSQIYKK